MITTLRCISRNTLDPHDPLNPAPLSPLDLRALLLRPRALLEDPDLPSDEVVQRGEVRAARRGLLGALERPHPRRGRGAGRAVRRSVAERFASAAWHRDGGRGDRTRAADGGKSKRGLRRARAGREGLPAGSAGRARDGTNHRRASRPARGGRPRAAARSVRGPPPTEDPASGRSRQAGRAQRRSGGTE